MAETLISSDDSLYSKSSVQNSTYCVNCNNADKKLVKFIYMHDTYTSMSTLVEIMGPTGEDDASIMKIPSSSGRAKDVIEHEYSENSEMNEHCVLLIYLFNLNMSCNYV